MDSPYFYKQQVPVHRWVIDIVVPLSIVALILAIGLVLAAIWFSNKEVNGQQVSSSTWNSLYGYAFFTGFWIVVALIMILFFLVPAIFTRTSE